MRHQSGLTRTMPMRLPSRNMHHIAHLQLPRLLSFRTNEASPHSHCQNLTALMGMPVGASAWRETDVVAHAVFSVEDRVHVHGAGESLGGLARGRVGLVGGADELHDGERSVFGWSKTTN